MVDLEIEQPFIHIFRTPSGHYIYDVNTNAILKISKNTYECLEKKNYSDAGVLPEIKDLVNQGYLKSRHVEESYNPITPYIHQYLDTKVCNLVLQITQNCNLRCEYCAYSGSYKNRIHSNKRMTFEVAAKAIDFVISHSEEAEQFYIGFYGGEPLLEFPLIKRCVDYANRQCEGRKIKYHLTTNATLLYKEIVEYLMENDFDVLISLDGPEPIHDKYRKFAASSKGSYQQVMESINEIRKISQDYFKNHIRFNAVLDYESSFEDVACFFTNGDLFEKDMWQLSEISTRYICDVKSVSDTYIEEYEYALFKYYLYKLKRIKKTSGTIFNGQFEYLKRFMERFETLKQTELPPKWHHGGPCVPGIVRLFVDTDGKMFPCERVSEVSEIACIGNVYDGWNYENILQMLNLEKATSEKCRNCWAYQYCTTCIGDADGITHISSSHICNHCNEVLRSVEAQMKDYVVLRELGYSSESEFLQVLYGEENESNTVPL